MSVVVDEGHRPGERIDTWVIDSVVGQGGMGTVYRCRNLYAERITAAIKILSEHRLNDTARRRFVREAEILFTLDHPGIVRVRNVRVDATPAYLEMDYVDGTPLDRVIEAGAMPVDRALHLFAQLADAVAYMHSRGVQHRDLKPENMIVTDDDRLVLVDFGLARDNDAARITNGEVLFGTVSYAPPEWVVPSMLDPERWDVYSLGVVLYELLTGVCPFPMSGHGSLPQQAVELMSKKMASPPLDPGPGFSDPVRRLVQALTHPVPEHRPACGLDVIQSLRGLDIADWTPVTREREITAPSAERRPMPTLPPDDFDIVAEWNRDATTLPQRVRHVSPVPLSRRATLPTDTDPIDPYWLGAAATALGLLSASVAGSVMLGVSWVAVRLTAML